MRLMSVSLTEQPVRDRTKTVTRRLGWRFLKVGDHITLCRKVMGRKPGEPLVRICDVEIVDIRRERLDAITQADVVLEGFPSWSTHDFVIMFMRSMKCDYQTVVTRIEWRYMEVLMAGRQGSVNAAKTHCPQGHEYTTDNLLRADLRRGRRGCKACHYERKNTARRLARRRTIKDKDDANE